MTETQAEVMTKIEAVAKSRGESVDQFMAGDFGTFWNDKFYSAEPEPEANAQIPESAHYEKAASIPETSGFTLLREEARRLLVKDQTLTEAQAVVKASELYPELTARHVEEIRKVARG
jgi:hypothetical protein